MDEIARSDGELDETQAAVDATPPRYPEFVSRAGYIWFCTGTAILLTGAVIFIMTLGVASQDKEIANMAANPCFLIFSILAGFAYISGGSQMVNRKGSDTVFYTMGAFAIGILFFLGGPLMVINAAMERPVLDNLNKSVLGLVVFVIGAGLLTGGILTVVARREYYAWRIWSKKKG